jgi:hypothetical protein
LGLAAEAGVVGRAAGLELVAALEEDPALAAVRELVVEVQAVVPVAAAVSAAVEPSPGNG